MIVQLYKYSGIITKTNITVYEKGDSHFSVNNYRMWTITTPTDHNETKFYSLRLLKCTGISWGLSDTELIRIEGNVKYAPKFQCTLLNWLFYCCLSSWHIIGKENMNSKHIKARTKWPLVFRRWHFEMHCLEWKHEKLDFDFIEIWLYTLQAITWTNVYRDDVTKSQRVERHVTPFVQKMIYKYDQ